MMDFLVWVMSFVLVSEYEVLVCDSNDAMLAELVRSVVLYLAVYSHDLCATQQTVLVQMTGNHACRSCYWMQ